MSYSGSQNFCFYSIKTYELTQLGGDTGLTGVAGGHMDKLADTGWTDMDSGICSQLINISADKCQTCVAFLCDFLPDF